MNEETRLDIFEKAKTYGSFNNWLTNLPEEDLQYISDVTDQVSANNLQDTDTFSQLCAVAMHFKGETELSEDELFKAIEVLTIFIACELNVRRGDFTKEGFYSMVPGEDTAKLKITPQGRQRVQKMVPKDK